MPAQRLISTLSIASVLAGVCVGHAYDPDGLVSVQSRAAADSVTVGQRFLVTHEFTYPDSLRMLPMKPLDYAKTRVLSSDWSETTKARETTRRLDMWVIGLDLDGAVVPAQEAEFVTPAGDTVRTLTREMTVPMRYVATDSSSLLPLKDQWEAPRSVVGWLAAAAAAIALAALAWWWRRRRSNRVAQAPAAPRLPADYVALSELSRIERMGLLESGEFKRYYTLVVDAVRRYIEARYGIEAMDRTTAELVDEMSRRGLAMAALETLLAEADLVKFAKYAPTREGGEAAMHRAREIVVTTAPRPLAVAGGEPAPAERTVG